MLNQIRVVVLFLHRVSKKEKLMVRVATENKSRGCLKIQVILHRKTSDFMVYIFRYSDIDVKSRQICSVFSL